jgi:hypothetical protein
LPQSAKEDAEHVAVAATHGIEFLVTWNCKRLANPVITPKVARACERAGFRSPEICTPEIILRRVVYGTLPSHGVTRAQSCRARPVARCRTNGCTGRDRCDISRRDSAFVFSCFARAHRVVMRAAVEPRRCLTQ